VVGRFTVTVNEQLAMPPQAFVTVQVTTVVPSGKRLPEGGEQTIGPLKPVALTLKTPTALLLQVTITWFGGQVMVGLPPVA